MASLQTGENRRDAREHPTQKHRKPVTNHKLTAGIDTAIKSLLLPPMTQQKLLSLFDNRVPFSSIRAWRYGWSRPPIWAVELLQAKLEAHVKELYRALATVESRGAGPGERGTRHLAAWRERKARERDEKEKAARERATFNREPGNET